MVLACCVIRDRPRASKKSLRVPRTIQAESAARPLTARSTFRGRCSRATSKRKPRKYISTSRSLDVEASSCRTFVVEKKFLLLILLILKTLRKRNSRSWREERNRRKDESSSSSSTTTSFVLKKKEENNDESTVIDQRRLGYDKGDSS